MKLLQTKIIFLLVFFIALASCDIKDSDAPSSKNFSRVYETENTNLVYYPTDLIQTEDKGFLILSSMIDKTDETIEYPLIHLIKTDESGKFIWQTTLDNSFQSAVPDFLRVNNQIFLVCMNAANNYKSTLLRIEAGQESAIATIAGFDNQRKFPLAAYAGTLGEIVVLSYDDDQSHINGYDITFSNIWHVSESAIDLDGQISNHLGKRSAELPFFISEVQNSSTYYTVNAYRKVSLALLFVKKTGNSASISGRLAGYQDDGVFSSACHLEENLFAISRYYVGDNFIYPGVEINPEAVALSNNFEDIPMPELQQDAKFQVIRDVFNTQDLILYTSTTSSNQIVLYFFDALDYTLVKTHYLGHTNPVEVENVIRTEDGSIAILGTTRVAGRYQRPILYKVSLDELGF